MCDGGAPLGHHQLQTHLRHPGGDLLQLQNKVGVVIPGEAVPHIPGLDLSLDWAHKPALVRIMVIRKDCCVLLWVDVVS